MSVALVLEDGTVYRGVGRSVPKEAYGEMAVNTAMAGYEDVLTDPASFGRILVMTYPLVGNYGMPEETARRESRVGALIVRQLTRLPSGVKRAVDLERFLEEQEVPVVERVDTRAITRHLRGSGPMRGAVVREPLDVEEVLERLRERSRSLPGAERFLRRNREVYGEGEVKLVLVDLGAEASLIEVLLELGCEVHAVPAETRASDILALAPHGVLLSNGPGDPEELQELLSTVRELAERTPLFGIGLGVQLLSAAMGGRVERTALGHRGMNFAVRDLASERVYVTRQNHGSRLDPDSLEAAGLRTTHVNVNDGEVEGIAHGDLRAGGIQFCPEGAGDEVTGALAHFVRGLRG